MNQPKLLAFEYVNWRGDKHSYLVEPESIGWEQHGNIVTAERPRHWMLNAKVLKRDEEDREGVRRTFILKDIENIEEIGVEHVN